MVCVMLAIVALKASVEAEEVIATKLFDALDHFIKENTNKYSLTFTSRARGHIGASTSYTYIDVNIDMNEVYKAIETRHDSILQLLPSAGVTESGMNHISENERLLDDAKRLMKRINALDTTASTREPKFIGIAAFALASYDAVQISIQGKQIQRLGTSLHDFTVNQEEFNKKLLMFSTNQQKLKALKAVQTVMEYQRKAVEHLKETLEQLERKRLPTHFINPYHLEQVISQQFGKHNKLPRDVVFSLPIVSKVKNNILHIIMALPSTSSIYQLKYVNEVKLTHETKDGLEVWDFETKGFVATDDNDWFIELTAEDLLMCQHVDTHLLFLCQNGLAYSTDAPTCMASILRKDARGVLEHCEKRKDPFMITRIDKNTYRFDKPYPVRAYCKNGLGTKVTQPTTELTTSEHCFYRIGKVMKLQTPPKDQVVHTLAHYVDVVTITEKEVAMELEADLQKSQNILDEAEDAEKDLEETAAEDYAQYKQASHMNFWLIIGVITVIGGIIVGGIATLWCCKGKILARLGGHVITQNAIAGNENVISRLAESAGEMIRERYTSQNKPIPNVRFNARNGDTIEIDTDGDNDHQ